MAVFHGQKKRQREGETSLHADVDKGLDVHIVEENQILTQQNYFQGLLGSRCKNNDFDTISF